MIELEQKKMVSPEEKGDEAVELFASGCNCAQAVLNAFRDELPLDEETLLSLSAPFGGGIGRMREVCGAVSGMMMVVGLLYGDGTVQSKEKKAQLYALVQELAGKFQDENGSIVCRDLLGEKGKDTDPTPDARTAAYYKKRPCKEMVRSAAYLLQRRRIQLEEGQPV